MQDEALGLLRDSVFVTVGFGVLAFQKLQVRRRELEKALEGPIGEVERQVGRLLGRPAGA